LLLHDLHPVDLPTRVLGALENTRPYLKSHGGNVELVGIDEPGVVRLRLQGSCHGCPSSAMTLKLAIEQAIQEAAPDVTAIVVEGVQNGGHAEPAGRELVALESLRRPAADEAGAWQDLPDLGDFGGPLSREVDGREVLFCRVEGTLYAYGARCPACHAELTGAELTGQLLACPACSQGYDVIHAGRAADQPDLHLDPYPILTRDGRAQLALPPLRVAAVAG
jgi:Fe-S cluster biogenesis protein NfuA/nitrite reductase/ring-hydroxylating ferredoxin subunit